MPSEPNVGCFRSRPRREGGESSNSTGSKLASRCRGVRGKGRGEGWTRRCHFTGATPCATGAPGPRCHVPASVRRHILRRPPHPLPGRRPSGTQPRAGAAREQLERLEHLPPRWPPQKPAQVRPGAASDGAPGPGGLPGDRPGRRRPGPAPSGPPRPADSPPTSQKRIFAATRPASPLRWPPQARPAAQLRSPPQPGLHCAQPAARLLPDTSGAAGGTRPFCDARGRGSAHARERARGGAGLWERWRHRGWAPPHADVRLPAASLPAPPDAVKGESSASCVPQNAQLFWKRRRVEENWSPSFPASKVLQLYVSRCSRL